MPNSELSKINIRCAEDGAENLVFNGSKAVHRWRLINNKTV